MMIPNRSEELENFKTKINLLDYLTAQGFVLDRKKSSRASATMRGPANEKLIVSRRSNGVWIYFNVHDDNDAGTIIDWVAYRHRTDLGATRKILRQWTGASVATFPASHNSHELKSSTVDLKKVRAAWNAARLPKGPHPYLLHERKIPAPLLVDPAIHPMIGIDDRFGNALFPHFNKQGQLTGIEKKNVAFTGFSPGGQKSLWTTRPDGLISALVLSETAVDSLSYQALHHLPSTQLVSLAGQPSPHQLDCLTHLLVSTPSISNVIVATDNDIAGRKLADQLQSLVCGSFPDVSCVIDTPATANADWNDVLKARSATALLPDPS